MLRCIEAEEQESAAQAEDSAAAEIDHQVVAADFVEAERVSDQDTLSDPGLAGKVGRCDRDRARDGFRSPVQSCPNA